MPEQNRAEVTVVKESQARVADLQSKRGTMARIIDETIGAVNVDFHINTLRPGPQQGLLHYHNIRENVYYVLEGSIFIRTPNERYTVASGESAYIPAGIKHAVWNEGPGEARLIEIYAPCVENDFIKAED